MRTCFVPGYQVKQETIALGTSDFVIRSLLDKLQFSDGDGAAAVAGISSSAWPLFGLVWPSARILADAMQTQDIVGKRVLEIGCGLALASLVIHRRLGDITASDRHPLAKIFLEKNLLLNGLPILAYQNGNWDCDNPTLGKFDLIIASDVLYERHQPGILSRFIDLHANAAVDVVIVDPDRGNRNPFCRLMAGLGYVLNLRRAASHQTNGEAFKGHLLRFSRLAV